MSTTATQDQVQRFYDVEAESYDASRYETRRGRRRDQFHKEVLLRLLQGIEKQQSRVLEIGCGTGRLLEAVTRAGYPATGIDLSEKMLAQARKRLERSGFGHVPLLQTSELPFPAESFAAAYSIFVINLIPDYRQLLARVAAILEPGGVFIFNVPNLSSCYWPFGKIINWRQQTSTRNPSGARYSHWFSRREWQEALTDAGFDVEAVFGEPPWCSARDLCRPVNGSSAGALLCKSLFIKARRT